MFGTDCEFFVSVLEMDKEGYFMVSMTVSSINEEPFSSIVIILDSILDIFLKGLTLDIERICRSDELSTFNSHE